MSKGSDHSRIVKTKFDKGMDHYETHNRERLRKLRETFRKRKGGRR